MAKLNHEIEDDRALVSALTGPDSAALKALFDRYARVMLALATRILRRSEEAEDIVNDVFLELYRRPQAYSPDRGSVKSYLLMMTRSRALDHLRRQRRQYRVGGAIAGKEDMALSQIAGPSPDPANESEQHDIHTLMKRVFNALPEDERQALEWAFFDGQTHAQIANQTGIPLGTIKGRLRRGLHRLRAALGNIHGGSQP